MSLKILLVDDDPAHRLVAARAIKKVIESVNLDEAGSVSSAAEKINQIQAQNERFDIAVIDLKLDHESGIDVLKILRSKNSINELPVIIVSTSDLTSNIEECYLSGANCYLVKNVNPMIYSDNLYRAIKFLLVTNETNV